MATEDWTKAEQQAIEARAEAGTAFEQIVEPETHIDQAAFWARMEVLAETRKWEALVASKEGGQQWWRIGLAVGKSPEPLRQQFNRRMSKGD